MRYPLLTKILSSYSMTRVWRWVPDILPSEATPYYEGEGINGKGTYFRPEKYYPLPSLNSKIWYADGDDTELWDLVTEYEMGLKNVAHLNSENTEDLDPSEHEFYIGLENNPLQVGEFKRSEVGDLAKRKGFDSVLITGPRVDGGDALFLPAGIKPKVTTKRHYLALGRNADLIEQISKATGVKPVNGVLVFDPSQEDQVSQIMKKDPQVLKRFPWI